MPQRTREEVANDLKSLGIALTQLHAAKTAADQAVQAAERRQQELIQEWTAATE